MICSVASENALYSEWVRLREILVFWTATLFSLCILPPVVGCTAKGGNEDRSFLSEPGWSQFLASLEVGEEADDLGLIALSWIRVAGASHDHCELGLEPKLECPNDTCRSTYSANEEVIFRLRSWRNECWAV